MGDGSWEKMKISKSFQFFLKIASLFSKGKKYPLMLEESHNMQGFAMIQAVLLMYIIKWGDMCG